MTRRTTQIRRVGRLGLLALLALPTAACPRRSTSEGPGGAASSSVNSSVKSSAVAPPEPPLPSPALEAALDAALVALASGDTKTADTELAKADPLAGADPHFAFLVARVRATRFAMAADFDQAAAALVKVLPALARHPELRDEFSAHNTLMMIREAQGDPASALAENDQATLCAARGTWDPETRDELAFQKDRWHRAYLTRMLAESRTGSAKEALVAYARASLDEYRTRGFPDSVAVLDAYFAALDGRPEAALAAARRVDLEKDDDIEDLYLVVVGLSAGGDAAGAEAVRKAMRRDSEPRISSAVMLRWVDLDAKGTAGFTPFHAKTSL